MALEVGNLTVPVGADLGPITRDLERLKALLGQAESQTQGVGNAMRGVERQTKSLGGVIGTFAKQLAGIFAIRELIRFTDTWTDLTSRVSLTAGSIETGAAVMDQLQVIARRTYSSLEQTTEGYIRNAQTLRDLGRSTQDTLDYTEALNNALVVSGARADRAARVQEALGRGLAAGALRGQELNTVIESGGRVAELLAEELGTTVSGLRNVGQQGKITGDVIDKALVGNLEKLREEADSMPATIGDAFQLISNALLQTIGVFNSANEISGTFAEGLIFIADNMQRVLTWVATGAAVWGGYTAAIYALNVAANVTRASLIRLAVASGIGILIIGAGELIYRFTQLVKAAGGFGKALELLGDVAEGVWDGIVTSASGIPLGLESVWMEVRAGFTLMVRDLQSRWNDFLATFEQPALTFTFGGKTHELIGGLDLSDWKSDLDAASNAAANFRSRAAELRTEAGNLATEGFDKAREALAKLNIEVEKDSTDLSGDRGSNRTTPAIDKDADRKAKRLREAYQNILQDSRAFIAQQEMERQAIGLTDLEAAKLRATFDLLNQAQRAGIELTPKQTEELRNLAEQMAEAEHETRKLQERYDFAKDTFKGFFTDLKNELQNGASIWEAFGNAAANALQKIADKALDMALNGIFDMIFGAFGGFGGSTDPWAGLRGFANGTSFAPGGWSVVGERGPELLKLPAGAQVQANHRVMSPSQASFNGSNRDAGSSRVAIEIFVKDDGKIGAIARQEAGSVVEVSIRDYDTNQLPDSVQRISNHPRIRGGG